MDYQAYMGVALSEAIIAGQKNEVPVGAALFSAEGNLISKAHNLTITNNDPCAHAEILCIKNACAEIQNYRLLNTTLCVTIEPCVMCMGALIHARVGTVVFGAKDPKWGAVGSLYDFSNDERFNHKPKIISGVREEETRRLIQNFFKQKRKQRQVEKHKNIPCI